MTIPTVVISGNIGVGKSKVAQQVSEFFHACYIPESISETELHDFYSDPKKHAGKFQLKILDTRTLSLNMAILKWRRDHKGKNPSLIVMDRWLDDDLMFAKANRELGNINATDFEIYLHRHKRESHKYKARLSYIRILIDASPSQCHTNSGVNLKYLKILDKYIKRDVDLSLCYDNSAAVDLICEFISMTIFNNRYDVALQENNLFF